MAKPKGGSAVMASKLTPAEDDLYGKLDFYPTPPWAARTFPEIVARALPAHVWNSRHYGGFGELREQTCWEPACGRGHMAEALRPYFKTLHASDVHDYGRGYTKGSFLGEGSDAAKCPFEPDWIITNPPFALATEFALEALPQARAGIALLVRTQALEGVSRYDKIFNRFNRHRLGLVAQFAERVPMTKGRWDPKASTATAYCWLVWYRHQPYRQEHFWPSKSDHPHLVWIPPGQRERLTRPDDAKRFAVEHAGALL